MNHEPKQIADLKAEAFHDIAFTGWAAILSAVASLLVVITGILMFTLSPFFGGLNDLFSVLSLVLMLPLALALHLLLHPQTPVLSLAAVTIGIIGILVYSSLQALLVMGVLTYEQVSLANIVVSAAIGIWLILVNYTVLPGKVFPRGLAWAGLIAGAGFLVLVLGFSIYPIWSIWLGRWLLTKPQGDLQIGQAD